MRSSMILALVLSGAVVACGGDSGSSASSDDDGASDGSGAAGPSGAGAGATSGPGSGGAGAAGSTSSSSGASSSVGGAGGSGPCMSGQSACSDGTYSTCIAGSWLTVDCANGCAADGVCAPGTQAGASWPMFQGGPQHRSLLANAGPTSAAVTTTVTVPSAGPDDTYWLEGMTVAANGTIYVTSHANGSSLTAFDASGALLWQRPQAAAIPPVIGADGTLYVMGDGFSLDAVAPADGTTKWSLPLDVPALPASIGPDGTIYILDIGGGDLQNLRAIHPDGTEKWTYSLPCYDGLVQNGVVVAPDGTLYLGNTSADMAALHPDGTEIWSVLATVATLDVSTPALGPDGTIYQMIDDTLYAIDPADGTDKWNAEPNLDWEEDPVVGADGTVYIAGARPGDSKYDHVVEAFHPDGTRWWTGIVDSSLTIPPVVDSQGAVYVASSGCGYSFGNFACAAGAIGTLYRFAPQPAGTDLVATPSMAAPLPGTARYGTLAFRNDQLLVPIYPRDIVIVGM